MSADLANTVSACASVGVLIVALVAAIVALRQIRVAREIEALNAYEKYHHLCLEYPDLGCGAFPYDSAPEPERQKYIVFVLSVLLTLERVMALFPTDPDWRASFEDDLVQHRQFLCSPDFETFIGNLQPMVVTFIQRTAAKLHWDYPYAEWKRT